MQMYDSDFFNRPYVRCKCTIQISLTGPVSGADAVRFRFLWPALCPVQMYDSDFFNRPCVRCKCTIQISLTGLNCVSLVLTDSHRSNYTFQWHQVWTIRKWDSCSHKHQLTVSKSRDAQFIIIDLHLFPAPGMLLCVGCTRLLGHRDIAFAEDELYARSFIQAVLF